MVTPFPLERHYESPDVCRATRRVRAISTPETVIRSAVPSTYLGICTAGHFERVVAIPMLPQDDSCWARFFMTACVGLGDAEHAQERGTAYGVAHAVHDATLAVRHVADPCRKATRHGTVRA
jgi:hypothetical protein